MDKEKQIKTLIIVYSYHHNNTMKIAKAFEEILNAQIITPDEIDNYDLDCFDLIGFGAGIDSGKHYKPLLLLAEKLSEANDKLGFIFSTSAVQGKKKVDNDHLALRSILTSKGYSIIGEFSCKGFNTYSFLKFFGGMNKGRPDLSDIRNAEDFASKIKQDFYQ